MVEKQPRKYHELIIIIVGSRVFSIECGGIKELHNSVSQSTYDSQSYDRVLGVGGFGGFLVK